MAVDDGYESFLAHEADRGLDRTAQQQVEDDLLATENRLIDAAKDLRARGEMNDEWFKALARLYDLVDRHDHLEGR